MEKNSKNLRTMYALTLVLVPSILMAISSQYIESYFVRVVAQSIILFMQAVIVHGMFLNKQS